MARVLPVPAPARTHTGPPGGPGTPSAAAAASTASAICLILPHQDRGKAMVLAGVTGTRPYQRFQGGIAGVRSADDVHHVLVRLLPEPQEPAGTGRHRDR